MTTTDAKHTPTPTPWKISETGDDIQTTHDIAADMICMAPPSLMESRDYWPANAAYIVKAVNSHEALVKALCELKDCSNAIVGASNNDDDAQEAFDMYYKAQKFARAALNLANGGE